MKALVLMLWWLPLLAFAVNEDLAPENATGRHQPQVVYASRMMVVSAHPLASDAGMRVLEAGGTAMDAAVAVQAMLTLVEPQSSGIGGGGFLLHWDAKAKRMQAIDGRETAPMAADEGLFLNDNGKPLDFWQALVGGRAVGVPGVVKMLEMGHSQHGRLPWSSLFNDAILTAREGFHVSARLHRSIASGINPGLKRTPSSRAYFYLASGEPLPEGYLLTNPALADTLQLLAEEGADGFYHGALARQMVAAVQRAERTGLMSEADLALYQAKTREPLCRPFYEYRVCGMPPPTSGGVAVLQILGIMAQFELDGMEVESADYLHLLTQASRLAYADRARYLADSDFVSVPVNRLLNQDYLRQRSRLISLERDLGTASAGQLEGVAAVEGLSLARPSTSHFVIVDGDGNALSMTSSIEMAFGSTLMVGGFLLNNQLTDFSFLPEKEGATVANRVQPGKRPRSSMSPMMVLHEQQPVLLTGSPGGSRIINYVAQSMLAHLVGGDDIQAAVSRPHVSNRNGPTELEPHRGVDKLEAALVARGHQVKVRELNSGLHAIARLTDGRYQSGIDPRREGAARGR